MSLFTIPNRYYIVAIEQADHHQGGQRTVFVATDKESGDYYWSFFRDSAEAFDDLKKAARSFEDVVCGDSSHYMNNRPNTISNISLVQAVTRLDVIDERQIKRSKIQAALAKLTDEEKELLGLGV